MVKSKTYIVAALVTFVLIASGFLFNWYFTEMRQSQIDQDLISLQSSISESQLEMLYITEFTNATCEIIDESRSSTSKSLYEVNKRLIATEQNAINPSENFYRLKKDQTILYVKLWMLTYKMKEECNTNVSTILYFFDTHSSDSQTQGHVLDSVTKEYGTERVLIVPLDYELDSGIIRILARQFNVTKSPTLVLNENETLSKVVSRPEIEEKLNL